MRTTTILFTLCTLPACPGFPLPTEDSGMESTTSPGSTGATETGAVAADESTWPGGSTYVPGGTGGGSSSTTGCGEESSTTGATEPLCVPTAQGTCLCDGLEVPPSVGGGPLGCACGDSPIACPGCVSIGGACLCDGVPADPAACQPCVPAGGECFCGSDVPSPWEFCDCDMAPAEWLPGEPLGCFCNGVLVNPAECGVCQGDNCGDCFDAGQMCLCGDWLAPADFCTV